MKVFTYTPDGYERHCREGCAVENADGRLLDTFWGAHDTMAHILTDTERESACLRFDARDFQEVGSPSLSSLSAPREWLDRSNADRGTIPSQHGLRMRWFIRLGSAPDRAMRIANATQRVAEAAAKLRMASHDLKCAEADLAELLEEGD